MKKGQWPPVMYQLKCPVPPKTGDPGPFFVFYSAKRITLFSQFRLDQACIIKLSLKTIEVNLLGLSSFTSTQASMTARFTRDGIYTASNFTCVNLRAQIRWRNKISVLRMRKMYGSLFLRENNTTPLEIPFFTDYGRVHVMCFSMLFTLKTAGLRNGSSRTIGVPSMKCISRQRLRAAYCETLAPSVLKSCTDNQTLIRLEAFQRSLF